MATKKVSAAQFLKHAMELSGKSQKEIAAEVGLNKANFLTMMKQGTTKIPLVRVPGLARACGVDPAHFLQIVMIEYEPETWEIIQQGIGEVLTKDERKMLADYRSKRDSVYVEDDDLVE